VTFASTLRSDVVCFQEVTTQLIKKGMGKKTEIWVGTNDHGQRTRRQLPWPKNNSTRV